MTSKYSNQGTLLMDMEKNRTLTKRFFQCEATLPISFIYNDKKIRGIPCEWNPVHRKYRIDSNIIQTIYEGNDINTGLNIKVECLEYFDYPVVEWTALFTNNSTSPTPILSNILAMDTQLNGISPSLYHCNGDFYSETGYTPELTPINTNDTLEYAPNGGRPCDGAFPYYRIMFEGCGLTMAIGWPGQWSANFTGIENGVGIKVGQQKTNMYLKPGETIRTPKMTLMSWTGDSGRSVNLWRRWYLAHVLPKPNGSPLKPMMSCAATDEGEEFTAATEQNQVAYMDKFKNKGFDYDVWWIDAGWYPCYTEKGEKRWSRTGTWKPDAKRFPNGLKPISDNATKNGADFLLWFEPERVFHGSLLDTEYPEWVLKIPNKDKGETPVNLNGLLNLGNTECRKWITDYLCKFIKDNGVKIYRQDFNFSPLEYWVQNESQDRQGINENLHVQGYLQMWDDILERNPGLWIDSCASGGRRNDLETMRRSVPLHYTDYGYGMQSVKTAFHHTLYSWIPYFKDMALEWNSYNPQTNTGVDLGFDKFAFHCGMAPFFVPSSVDICKDDYDFESMKKMIAIWRKASYTLLHGDYYPFTEFSKSDKSWVAWQFDRPEIGEGLIQGIRHKDCPQESLTVYPKVACADAVYVFENTETNETLQISGSILSKDGFTFNIPKRAGALWFYSVKR